MTKDGLLDRKSYLLGLYDQKSRVDPETKEEYHWSKLICGIRVEDDTVIIKVKGGNDEARFLCKELIHEMQMNKEIT
jgi:hypothetical protein